MLDIPDIFWGKHYMLGPSLRKKKTREYPLGTYQPSLCRIFLVSSEFACRLCGPGGRWKGHESGDFTTSRGFTNYIDCFEKESFRNKELVRKTTKQKQVHFDVQ